MQSSTSKTPIGLFKFAGGNELPPRQYPLPILRRDTVPYTTKQIEQFNKAIQLHARMNHINDAALGKLLDNGSILNINVTSDDLKTARSLWGPCTSCLIGKMTSPVQSISPNLLCIDDRTGFMNVVKLESKSIENQTS